MKTKIKKLLIFPLILLIVSGPSRYARGQTPEYGSVDELKGVTKIYVFTGNDLEVRENIVNEIRKKLPHLIVTNTIAEADVSLAFDAFASTTRSGSVTTGSATASVFGNTVYGSGSSVTTPVDQTVIYATGFVVRFTPENRIRLLMQFSDVKSIIWERRPSTNFARAFVKAYKKANKEN